MKKILIIGGHPDARAALKRMLERRADVVEANEEALGVRRLVEGAGFDCLLLGHVRPDSDALDILNTLRNEGETLLCPVVVFGRDPERSGDLGRAALRAGAMEFVDEAWMSPEALMCAVENAVNRFAVSNGEKGEKRTESFATQTLDNIFAFVGLLELDGTLLEANQAPLDAAGIRVEDVRGQKFWDCPCFDHGEARESVREACLRAARGETIRYDVTVHLARDTWATLDLQVAPLQDGRGRITHLIPSAVDITQRKRAEEALRQSERRLSRILETPPLGIIYWEAGGRVRDANDEFLRMTGYDRDDLVAGRVDWVKMTPPEYHEQDARVLEDIRRLGTHAPFEKEYVRKDGSRVGVIVGSAFVEGMGGIAFILDITERKRAESRAREALARAEAERGFFDAMLEAAPVGIIVANASGQLVRMNPANERLWGHAPVSMSVDEYREWKGWWADGSERHGRALEPEDWALWRALRGETVRGDIVEIEPFGEPSVRRTLINSGAPVRDSQSRILGAVVAQMDITERVRMEAALRESEARFRALADNMSQFAWISDEKGRGIWHNQRWYDYTGTTPEEMLGWGWAKLHHPDHLERVAEKFKRHLAAGEAWEDTFPLRGKDGTYRWFLSRAIPIRDERGKVVQWFGTNTDITAQREAEEALREADRRKDEFLAMLAHELRNPLAPLRTAVHIMRRLSPQDPGFERASAVLDRQVTHMARLIDDLLDVSRIARGKLELRKELCDFARIARQTTEDYRASLESSGLSLVVRIPRENVWVKGDPTRLAQMVGNLLHNASKFTDSGGRVDVSVEVDADGQMASLTVRDTGVGMDPSLLSRLFDPFCQAEQGIARSKGGLGLGLALTKGLVELHDGTVTAHSDGLGRGSTFVLRLPLDASVPQAIEAHSTTAPADRLRVMVIEDNTDMAETLAQLLSLSGYHVDVAHDGRAGIAAALSTRPDVVISDIGLPGGTDGYAVARTLRADARMGSAFLIALSGYAQAEDRRRSKEAGFDAHLAKPPDLDKLMEMLARTGVREQR